MSETSNDAVNALLNQYERNNSKSNSSSNKNYDLNNYFTTFLPDGVNSATKRVRILPNPNGGSPLTEVMGHGAEVDGGYRTFVCLKHEKKEACPFCEAKDALFATGKPENKKLAGKYSPRKMYIAKVIDRDKEDWGVKFWRFKHDNRKTGTFDKIHGVVSARKEDITNAETGRDLIVTIIRDHNGRPQIQSIVDNDRSPLSDNATKAQEWLSDGRTWEDVYSVKSYDYLSLIVQGHTPRWDKVNEKWVSQEALESGVSDQEGDDLHQELTMGNVSETPMTDTPQAPVSVEATTAPEVSTEEDEDDLPF